MEEKKYLKWYNKIGYGSGDIAGNIVYAFLTSFVMVYLTDTIGLASGIVGTLIAVSKLLDGFTDIFFGSMIDKTHSKMGKARPWMLYGYIGCAITLVACFAVPTSLGRTAQYAWFFIAYTLLNGVFYTANNIAYSALTSLVTKNSKERVQMGSYRFIFAFSTNLLIQAVTVGFVAKCGGDAAAWRMVAIIYAVIASCSEYTYLTQGKRVDGTMYSCTSLGVKIGGGIGTAVVGWLLELSGYVGTHAVQSQSALNMMQFMYLWLPLIFDVLIMFILFRMNVEETNVKIKKEKEMGLW